MISKEDFIEEYRKVFNKLQVLEDIKETLMIALANEIKSKNVYKSIDKIEPDNLSVFL